MRLGFGLFIQRCPLKCRIYFNPKCHIKGKFPVLNFYHISLIPSSFFLSLTFTVQIVFSIQMLSCKGNRVLYKSCRSCGLYGGCKRIFRWFLFVYSATVSQVNNLIVPLMGPSCTNVWYCLFWAEGGFFEGSFENEGSICGSDSTFYRQTEGMLPEPRSLKHSA